jgi:hypothetical protein
MAWSFESKYIWKQVHIKASTSDPIVKGRFAWWKPVSSVSNSLLAHSQLYYSPAFKPRTGSTFVTKIRIQKKLVILRHHWNPIKLVLIWKVLRQAFMSYQHLHRYNSLISSQIYFVIRMEQANSTHILPVLPVSKCSGIWNLFHHFYLAHWLFLTCLMCVGPY